MSFFKKRKEEPESDGSEEERQLPLSTISN